MRDEFNRTADNHEQLTEETGENMQLLFEGNELDKKTAAEMEQAQKIITANDEIAELNKTVLGQLENPLVVHKKSDASYDEKVSVPEMHDTHLQEKKPTLMRHRFKKEKKGKGSWVAVLAVLVVAVSVFVGLYVSGNITFSPKQATTKQKETTTAETTTSLEERFRGTIVVKNMYIFVDGVEVDGIEGLQNELKYLDKSETAFTIIDENANTNFLNFEILPLLEQLGFYGEATEITHLQSTGLIAEAETTTAPPSTTVKPKTTNTKKAKANE